MIYELFAHELYKQALPFHAETLAGPVKVLLSLTSQTDLFLSVKNTTQVTTPPPHPP